MSGASVRPPRRGPLRLDPGQPSQTREASRGSGRHGHRKRRELGGERLNDLDRVTELVRDQ